MSSEGVGSTLYSERLRAQARGQVPEANSPQAVSSVGGRQVNSPLTGQKQPATLRSASSPNCEPDRGLQAVSPKGALTAANRSAVSPRIVQGSRLPQQTRHPAGSDQDTTPPSSAPNSATNSYSGVSMLGSPQAGAVRDSCEMSFRSKQQVYVNNRSPGQGAALGADKTSAGRPGREAIRGEPGLRTSSDPTGTKSKASTSTVRPQARVLPPGSAGVAKASASSVVPPGTAKAPTSRLPAQAHEQSGPSLSTSRSHSTTTGTSPASSAIPRVGLQQATRSRATVPTTRASPQKVGQVGVATSAPAGPRNGPAPLIRPDTSAPAGQRHGLVANGAPSPTGDNAARSPNSLLLNTARGRSSSPGYLVAQPHAITARPRMM
jgi:hypothetical protein